LLSHNQLELKSGLLVAMQFKYSPTGRLLAAV
jgi:hypothetical protein